MTSAAYGVGRDSIADGVAERCQVSAFFVPTAQGLRLPDEESRTRHAPSERGALWVVRQPGLEPGELSGVVSGQLLNVPKTPELIEGIVVKVFGLAFRIEG